VSSDLRAMLEAVLDAPLVEPRPTEQVLLRGRRIVARNRRRRTLARFVVLVLLTTAGLRWVVLDPADDRVQVADAPEPPAEPTTSTSVTALPPLHEPVAAPVPHSPSSPGPVRPSPVAPRPSAVAAGDPARCKRLESVAIVRIGVAFDLVYGARAAADRLNRTGGICRRSIDLVVGPGDEDVLATVAPYDGTSTDALARIAAQHAYRDIGARSFAVVHESAHSAVARAFGEYVKALPEAVLRASQPLEGDVDDEATAVAQACDGGCDAVLLALGPEAVTAWLRAGGPTATRETAVLPAVLTPAWPYDCLREAGERCGEVALWTPYRLPGASRANADLDEYRRDARLVGHDPADAGFQAAYVGMRALAATLEGHEGGYESGLVGPRGSAREMRMRLDDGAFLGWQDVSEDWHHDPSS
jgi:hypothetical protein